MAPRFGYGGPFTFCAPGSPWHLRAFAEVNSRRQNDVPAWEVLQYGEDLNADKNAGAEPEGNGLPQLFTFYGIRPVILILQRQIRQLPNVPEPQLKIAVAALAAILSLLTGVGLKGG